MAAHEEDDKLHLHMAINMTAKLEKELQDTKDRTTKLEKKLLKFKFMDYQERKDQDERVVSPSYYTSPNGYHMALSVYANGSGTAKGTRVSVYTHS